MKRNNLSSGADLLTRLRAATTRGVPVIVLGTLAWTQVAVADDYKPVKCDKAKSYKGRPLHPPLSVKDFRASGSFDGNFDADTISRFTDALSKAMAATKARSITVSVARPGQGSWSAVRTANQSTTASTTALPQRFWWASAGKMFTAVAVLQLTEEGRLSLSDPISKYVEGVPNGKAITIEHLLNHTSGLFSANEDKEVRANPRRLTREEELTIARRHGAMFCPGQNWRYSNTGYSLLGAVIEKLEGKSYSQVVTRRIINRLGSTSLRVLEPDDPASDVASLAPTDPKEPKMNPAWAGAAGGIVGLAEDMNRFMQALLTSELLKPETTQKQFARLYPMFDEGTFYGLGTMLYKPPGTQIYWIGHGGGAPGAKAISVWSPQDKAFVSVALTGDGSAEATANLLLRALSKSRPQSK